MHGAIPQTQSTSKKFMKKTHLLGIAHVPLFVAHCTTKMITPGIGQETAQIHIRWIKFAYLDIIITSRF